MADQGEIARLWQVNRTIHELVRDRGFQISDEEISLDIDAFKNIYANAEGIVDRTRLSFIANHRTTIMIQIFVFFFDEMSVRVKDIRRVVDLLEEKMIERAIIIFPGSMTPAAHKSIAVLSGTRQYILEEFSQTDLLVNITHHVLVPQHEILTKDEKKALLERYGLKESQLPRIQIADPVARYYGVQRGQVVKITRPSETAGRYATYRICF